MYTHGRHFIVIVTEHMLYSTCVCWCACVCMSVVCGHLESETFCRLINHYVIITEVSVSLCIIHSLASCVFQIPLPTGLSRSSASGKH